MQFNGGPVHFANDRGPAGDVQHTNVAPSFNEAQSWGGQDWQQQWTPQQQSMLQQMPPQQSPMQHHQQDNFHQSQQCPPGRNTAVNAPHEQGFPQAPIQDTVDDGMKRVPPWSPEAPGFCLQQVARDGVRQAIRTVCNQYCHTQVQEENLVRILQQAGVFQAALRAAHDAACTIVQAFHQPNGQMEDGWLAEPGHPHSQQGVPSQPAFRQPTAIPPESRYTQPSPMNVATQSWSPVLKAPGMGQMRAEIVAEHWGQLARSLLLASRRVIAAEGKCLLGLHRASFNVDDFSMTRQIIQQRPDWLNIFPELSEKVTPQPYDLPSGNLRRSQQVEGSPPQPMWSFNSVDGHSQQAPMHDIGSTDSAVAREPWMTLKTYDSLPDVAFHPIATTNTLPDLQPSLIGFQTMDSLPEIDEQGIAPNVRNALNSFLHIRGL